MPLSRWRLFHYSASSAVALTALAALYVDYGGLLILVPGLVGTVFLEVLLSRLLTDGDFYPVPAATAPVLSAAFYFVLIYFALLLRARLGEG